MRKTFDILSVGTAYLDINFGDLPFKDGLMVETETVGPGYRACLGGSALKFTKISSSIKLKPIFIGKLGKDVFGEEVKKLAKESKIKTAFIESADVQTNLGLNFTNKKGKSLLANAGSANQTISYEEAIKKIKENLPKVKYFYIGGYMKLKMFQPHYPEIIKIAKKHGVKIIMDHGRISNLATKKVINNLKKLFKDIDVYLPSEDEFLQVWQHGDINKSLKDFNKEYPNIKIMVKHGEKGAIGIKDGEIFRVKAFSVTPKNTVGAGDSFNAGFIKGQIDGKSLEESAKFGNAVAGLYISQNDKWPSVEDANKLIKTSKLKR